MPWRSSRRPERRGPGRGPNPYPSRAHARGGVPGPPDAPGHRTRCAGRRQRRIAGRSRHRRSESHLGARYVWGSTGPKTFDCSGLVYRAFREAHLAKHIGGFNTAHGYYYSFRHKGKTSRTNGRPGDIVVYDHGGHVGIYLGHGKVISALLSGVKVHPLQGINIRFTTFIHLGLSQAISSVASRASEGDLSQGHPQPAIAGQAGSTAPFAAQGRPRAARLEVLGTRDRGSARRLDQGQAVQRATRAGPASR